MVTKNQTAKAEKNSQTTSLLDQVMEHCIDNAVIDAEHSTASISSDRVSTLNL